MSAISEDGLGGPSFGLGNCICMQRDGHVRVARVKPDDVIVRRAGARKIRADGRKLMGIFADSVCGIGNTATVKSAIPSMTGGLLVESMTGNMPSGFPTMIGTRVGRDQALLGGFVLDAGSRTELEKLP